MSLTYNETLKAVKIVLGGNNVPSIVGNAGVGKSALVKDLAKQNSARLFTTVVSLSEKGDLSIPVPPLTSDSFIQTRDYGKLADVQFGYSHTLIEIINYAQSHPKQDIYWFLDEFNRGSQAVQSELMNVVLQRQIHSLKLPKQVKIIIAENPDSTMSGFSNSNYSVSYSDDAIKDRTTRIIMGTNVDEWLQWAIKDGVYPLIIQYLKANPEMLLKNNDEDLHPTPRAWKRVSDNLIQLEQTNLLDNYKLVLEIVSGDLGALIANDFCNFLNTHLKLLSVEDILNESVNDLTVKFKNLNEAAKSKILFNLLHKIDLEKLLTEQLAYKLLSLIDLVSLDGQYALVLKINNETNFINYLFETCQNTHANEYVNLYQKIQKIAFIEFR
ncbi:ATP-binding protein [Apilactobacillus xinyiensis]|uniref:ATP-binding protein n=1 Tax=Apilactobacillus xinyiensis TaxID=2841032 RepID=A0ABT0I0K4_9LACO|nr:ATP-binding protein [Apilactobacillus xinyiensis]MCK8624149.1 ATP-binding protein [Apilactobacillus xinyiensis]MCL0329427.1 ATP-binding protein [Apilactobacillus xinyiensis]